MKWINISIGSKYKLSILLFILSSFLMADAIVLSTHKIDFIGQKYFDKSVLEDAVGVENKSFFEFWKKDDPRIKDKWIPKLPESLTRFYESQGFYDVKVTLEKTKTKIILKIKEGMPVRVKSIEIQSDYNISSFVQFKKGDIFRAQTFIENKNNIISSLLKAGYCSYDLDTKAYVDLEKHSVDLHYKLKKGGVCTFGKLTLSGLKSIDKDIIVSRVRALEGKRFSTKLVQDTSNALYRLNAFDSVLINVDRKFYNVIPVDIVFEEMEKQYHFEAGIGYDTYVGPRVHGELTKYNFFGNAQKLKLKAMWSEKEQLMEVNFFRPAYFNFFGYYLDIGLDVGYSNLEFDGFQEEKAFSKSYYQYENENLTLKFGLAAEVINISKLDNLDESETLKYAVNDGQFILTYPYVDMVYDTRDSKLNPKYGYYLAAYSEIGLANEEDATVYMKVELEGRVIYTFSDLTLAAVGKVGVLDDESDKGLPESKYFFGGGSFSNRAYGFRDMGIIDTKTVDTIYGASSMLNLSLEADYPIWGDLYGALFTDNTMLTDQAYNFKGEVISSGGVGVRYMTPIGPLKFDVGFNVNDPSIYGISFQIGQSF